MTLTFKTSDTTAVFLNPFLNFERSAVTCQLRWDPLTGRSGRLAHFVGFKPAEADVSGFIEASGKNCPFCPENVLALTPKFLPDQIPEGRLQQGESVLFPNLLPYDVHSALAVLCRQHYRSLSDFQPRLFVDAFTNCRTYLERVISDSSETYGLVTWNYMPAAGSSQVHPHFQVYATQAPGNFLQHLLSASQAYHSETGRWYWEDYIEEEIRRNERFIHQATHSIWLTDFVSLSVLSDVIAVFPGKQTFFDLDVSVLEETAQILCTVLDWLGRQGVYSLNMAWLPARKGEEHHWLQLRISPRLYLAPHVWCTDTPSLVSQYQESFMIRSPEEVAGELKAFFGP
jgi:galactose-1-phosphate uridylyltransferase